MTPRPRPAILWAKRGMTALATIAVVTGALVAFGRNTPTGSPIEFGVLGSNCAAERVNALKQAGVQLAQLDVRWDRLEPESGRLDQGYADELAAAVRTCRESGIKVILGLGLQHAPAWVRQLPDGEYLDQFGEAHDHVPNLVFSNDVRWAFGVHAENVLALLGPSGIHAIRLGTSEAGELGYPAPAEGNKAPHTGYWAFNDAAQTGTGLPPDVDKSPLPGWKPGEHTWRGRPVTVEQAAEWFSWYSSAAAAAVVWQAKLLRELGFQGALHVPLAGRGTLPADLRSAVASQLDGTGDRDGSLERGLYYPEQLRILRTAVADDGLVADVTGLDDATAVQARSRRPATDVCSPGDHRVDLEIQPDVEQWSASRWTIANAKQAGLKVMGENPGSPHALGTGAAPESDDLREQLLHAPRYAAECRLTTFLWAFEDDLFGDASQMTLNDFRRTIANYR